jgi:hypothetical protein
MQYYIGLSNLSTIYDTGAAHVTGGSRRVGMGRERFRAEERRILSLLEGRLLAKDDIAREAQGRPFFPGREAVDFNIAHSGVLTAISHVQGKNLRTGCDVERVQPRSGAGKIAEEFFSAGEKNYVFQAGFDEAKFYEIWTLKECFLKLRGLSVFDMAVCPSFIGEKNEFAFDAAVPIPLSFYLYELSGGMMRYMLAAALEGKEQQPPEIRWFSHLSLDCKKTAEIKAALNPAETVSPKI